MALSRGSRSRQEGVNKPFLYIALFKLEAVEKSVKNKD